MTIAVNGNGRFRISLAGVTAIASVAGAVIGAAMFIAGWIGGYRSLADKLEYSNQQIAELKASDSRFQEHLGAVSNKLIKLESDVGYIKDGVAALRLSTLPK